MSVANIFFMNDRILCLSDTVFYDGKTPAGLHDTKTQVYGRMAITTRGLVRAGNAVKAAASSYEDVDTAKPMLDAVHAMILDHKQNGDDELRVETTLMGWSEERSDLVAYRWEVLTGMDEIKFSELPRGMHLAPTFLTVTPRMPQDIDDDDRLVKVALAQYNVAQKMGWKMCIGGVMTVTEITADAIDQRISGIYPNYHQLMAEFGCPNEDAVANVLDYRKFAT